MAGRQSRLASLDMFLSPVQRQSSDQMFLSRLGDASATTNRAIDDVWRNYAPPNATPDAQDRAAIFQDLPRVRPKDIDAGISRLAALGTGRVTDPEGRVGTPVFVAGTSPTGANVPLDKGSLARLADTLSYVQTVDRPGAPWGGTTYTSNGTANPSSALLLNTAQNSLGTPPSDVLAHEAGHSIHNAMGRSAAPLAGANNAALQEFSNMSAIRGQESSVARPQGGSLGDYRYMLRPQEQFAEGIRQYLTNPNEFKAKYPEASKFLRGVINSDPRMRRLLMLSQSRSGGAYA